jgi:hypothetical protein
MNKIVLQVFLSFCSLLSIGQKQDYQWLFGYENEHAAMDTDFGDVKLDFTYPEPQITKKIRLADFDEDNVSYSDANGNLLFYSNGMAVFDRRDSVMLNGDSISLSWYWTYNIYVYHGYPYPGFSIVQGLLALPAPGDSTRVYLCHYTVNYSRTATYSDYPCDSSFYSIIDLEGNAGLGEVVVKNRLINSDTLSSSTFSAVRHGNGKDWWVLHPYFQGNNCIYEFLITDTGMGLYSKQCLGQERISDGSLSSSCFSPDGTKYFWADSYDGIRMFDFDRCTGLLSNPQVIPFPYPSFGDSVLLAAGVAVSPNNRYLYIACNIVLLQYDLWAPDIGASVDTVGVWDGSYDPSPYPNTFFLEQLGPDGKIYMNAPSSIKHLHIINNPDTKGDSCLFTQHSLYLQTTNKLSLPNFPNYRLGPWSGSVCDSLSAMTADLRAAKEKILKIFPNPATEYTIIDYGYTDWNKGQVSLEIRNALGQLVYEQPLPMYSGYQKIDVSKFAAGIYMAYIKRNNGVVASEKFVKE